MDPQEEHIQTLEFRVFREIYGECNSSGAFVHFSQHGTKDLFPQVH
jgi:hypothetical protein